MTTNLAVDQAPDTRPLHMFEIGDDWVCAYDADDAMNIWCEHTLYSRENAEKDGIEVDELRDESTLEFWCDEKGEICEIGTGKLVELTCGHWVGNTGRRFVGSRDY